MRVEPDDPSDSWSEQVMLGNLQVLALTILLLMPLYLGLKLKAQSVPSLLELPNNL